MEPREENQIYEKVFIFDKFMATGSGIQESLISADTEH